MSLNTKNNLYREILDRIDRGGNWEMIVVDGVVGVGKSTLMNILAERGLIAYEEPVVDNPILKNSIMIGIDILFHFKYSF